MAQTIKATDGKDLPITSLAKALTYSGTQVQTITVTYQSVTYVKTLTWSGTAVTNISQWVAQ